MKRLLFLLALVASIAGAAGMLAYGSAIADVFETALTYRIGTDEPISESYQRLHWAGISGVALTLGIAISCLAIVVRDTKRNLSMPGQLLLVASGALFTLGTALAVWSILGIKSSFSVIASAGATPRAEDIHLMVQSVVPYLTGGSVSLLTGALVSLAAIALCPTTETETVRGTGRSAVAMIAAIGAIGLGIMIAFLFAEMWSHGNALESMLTSAGGTPKPNDIANHLLRVANTSMFAFIGIGIQGFLQAVIALCDLSSPQIPDPELDAIVS